MKMKPSLLPYVEINPVCSVKKSVIWLHGLGADGHDFVPIVAEMNLPAESGFRFIFPHAPSLAVTINNGYVMPAWYDIVSFDINQRVDEKGLQESVQRVIDLIQHEEHSGIPASQIFLGGFSQGAVLALAAGLYFDKPLGGIVALSGYLPFNSNALAHAPPQNKNTPIFLGHGVQDDIVPVQLGEMVRLALTEHGYSIEWHQYLMGHGVCGEEIRDLRVWLIAR